VKDGEGWLKMPLAEGEYEMLLYMLVFGKLESLEAAKG
jgi:hypothetical protein